MKAVPPSVLLDTSAWIAHYRGTDPRITILIQQESVVMHPIVLGELAMGNLPDRANTIEQLRKLPTIVDAGHRFTLDFIEAHRAFGRGIGYNDVQLIASVVLNGTVKLLSFDRRLHEFAQTIQRAHTLATQ